MGLLFVLAVAAILAKLAGVAFLATVSWWVVLIPLFTLIIWWVVSIVIFVIASIMVDR